MNLTKIKKFAIIMGVCGLMTSCLSDDNDTIIVENARPATDIPSDKDAEPNPEIWGESNAIIPNIQYSSILEDGTAVIRIDMTGIQDTNTLEWLRLIGTGEKGQNVWVEVDGEPKGIKVYNSSDEAEEHTVPVDLVFTIDNSGSMDDEADAVARDVAEWAYKLSNTGLDIRFGCVGYDGDLTGAIDLTSASSLDAYLNRPGKYGTNRTFGFEGSNSGYLSTQARSYSNGYQECGMAAIRFADKNFAFRTRANRIYVNFTDEPNQDSGKSNFSVESLKSDWDTSRGTIHTVYSGGYDENNYLMSVYTGGTVINANSSFTGVTLESLPVTDAMRNSYIIRFTDIEEYIDGRPHTVKITVKSPDGSVQAERTFTVVFGEPTEPDDDEYQNSNFGTSTTFNGGFGEYKGEPTDTDFSKVNITGRWRCSDGGNVWYLVFNPNRSGWTGYDNYVDASFSDYKFENGHLFLFWEDSKQWEDEGRIEFIDADTFRINWENGWNESFYVFHRMK